MKRRRKINLQISLDCGRTHCYTVYATTDSIQSVSFVTDGVLRQGEVLSHDLENQLIENIQVPSRYYINVNESIARGERPIFFLCLYDF
jgi:hypothetical protein